MDLLAGHETITAATATFTGGAPMPDVSDLTMGVIDLSDTGHFVTEDPAVLVWMAAVAERGLAW